MSRSCWKSVHVSRVYRSQLIKVAGFLRAAVRRARKLSRAGRLINTNVSMADTYRSLGGLRLRGKIRKSYSIMTPKKLDTVLRVTSLTTVWQNMTYGIPLKLKRKKRRKLKKFYNVSKYAIGIKFGEYIRTRVFYGFRRQKDKKKIAKLKKDLKKAKQQKLHQRRENARLMRKAIMETRAANRKKAGAKSIKKKK